MRERKRSAGPSHAGKRRKSWLTVLAVLVIAGVVLFGILECAIGYYGKTQFTGEPEILVIFGCKVESWGPSVLLQDRLDTALDYLEEHPDLTVVVSGGQGNDEPQSEASAMRDYLTEHGFEGTVLVEDRSRNTWQNVNNTLALLEEKGYDETDGKAAAVSNGFHLLRIRMLWERAGGGELAGVLAAPASHKASALQMFFREPLALVKSFLVDQ